MGLTTYYLISSYDLEITRSEKGKRFLLQKNIQYFHDPAKILVDVNIIFLHTFPFFSSLEM
jgi:hypothetical protein